MRFIKIALYLLVVLALQTVVFARLNFFGVTPDLLLVSVIVFSVFASGRDALVFSAAGGFLQDILSFGFYLNTVVKVLVAILISVVRESFLGNEHSLSAGLVIVLTPAILIFEAFVYFYFSGVPIGFLFLLKNIVLGTLYNLLLLVILFPVVKVLAREK